jgi:hypothetical protein
LDRYLQHETEQFVRPLRTADFAQQADVRVLVFILMMMIDDDD